MTSETGLIQSKKRNTTRDADSTQACPIMHGEKMASLTDYTYNVLFLQGDKSDVTIHALKKVWHLHKNILCRSGYFSAMFSGAWKEADKSDIEMAVPEDTTPEALHTAFGSLYKDDVEVSKEHVVDVLKAASFLQIDALVDTCGNIMKKSISISTVCTYYYAAADLGLHDVTEACLVFLECVFVTENDDDINLLFFKNASIGLMEKVLGRGLLMARNDHELFVLVAEFATIQLRPPADNTTTDLLEYMRSVGLDEPFLCSEEGMPFRKLFRMLKLKQLVKLSNVPEGARELANAVYPLEDLHRAGYQQFTHSVDMNSAASYEPDLKNISEETFAKECVGCTVQYVKDFPRFSTDARVDLSHIAYLGHNFGMELDLIIRRRSKNIVTFCLSPRKIFRNRPILCRLQVVVGRVNTAPIRSRTGIVEMDLSDNKELEFVTVPLHVSPGKMTEEEVEDCFVNVGVQVQFVTPIKT